jgi:hypothetical protein
MLDDMLLQHVQRDRDREALILYIARRYGRNRDEVLHLPQLAVEDLTQRLNVALPALQAHWQVEWRGLAAFEPTQVDSKADGAPVATSLIVVTDEAYGEDDA